MCNEINPADSSCRAIAACTYFIAAFFILLHIKPHLNALFRLPLASSAAGTYFYCT